MPQSRIRSIVTRIIGILTIIMAPLAIASVYAVYFGPDAGGFGLIGTIDFVGGYDAMPYFSSYAIVIFVAALVIGIATLREKQWAGRANIIFQLISIPVILGSLGYLPLNDGLYFGAVTVQKQALLVDSLIVLILLFVLRGRKHVEPAE